MPFQFFQSPADDVKPLKIGALGLELAVRLPPNTSGAELTLLETVNAPGFGPPLHRHREAEIFRVLEGRYLFQVDDKRFEAAVDDVVSVPGGAAHAFVNITDRPARQLVLMLPGMDAQAFFLGLSEVFLTKPSRDDLNAFGKPWGSRVSGSTAFGRWKLVEGSQTSLRVEPRKKNEPEMPIHLILSPVYRHPKIG